MRGVGWVQSQQGRRRCGAEGRPESQQDSYAVLGRAVAGLMEEDASFRALVVSLLCRGIFSPPGSRS